MALKLTLLDVGGRIEDERVSRTAHRFLERVFPIASTPGSAAA